MHKFYLTPIIFSFLALAIPTIAFEDNSKNFNIKYQLNASLDELVLNYCNTYDSYTINKLYSEKEILKNDNLRFNKKLKFLVNIRNKPLNPSFFSNIKMLNTNTTLSNFTELDLVNLSNVKKDFVRTVLPLIIIENQKILSLRDNLYNLSRKLKENKSLSSNELKIIKQLSRNYKIKYNTQHKLEIIDELLKNIDVIPNSIVLAQAAIESGWGSSRFAKEHNALFGEYTYDNNKGVIPLERENGEKHLIKSFNSYNSSVKSYFNNINTHYAYKEFREIRNIMRKRNNFKNINLLVDKLDTYAEDKNYINTIKEVIQNNKFKELDLKTLTY